MTETEPDIERHPLAESKGVSNPLVLLQSMIERGTDPDALKKMMDLAERWQANQAQQAYSESMADCQAEMPTVVKDETNKGTNSRYALRETISRAIKPCYTKHGFSLSFSTADCPLPEHLRIVCEVGHRAGHTKTKTFDIPLDGTGPKGGKSSMNAPQATGSTYSYGIRYATLAIFNVAVAGQDDDAAGYSRFLTQGHIVAINTMIEDIRRAETEATAAGKIVDRPFDFKRFLAWLEAESLETVPASKFDSAVDVLDRKRKVVAK